MPTSGQVTHWHISTFQVRNTPSELGLLVSRVVPNEELLSDPQAQGGGTGDKVAGTQGCSGRVGWGAPGLPLKAPRALGPELLPAWLSWVTAFFALCPFPGVKVKTV